ncbi:MAG: hypothetical protein JW798_11565 [Prolixibacteraceae bacterium]|nr:hypothetical protein [Prolixibacteraceae bacterium]
MKKTAFIYLISLLFLLSFLTNISCRNEKLRNEDTNKLAGTITDNSSPENKIPLVEWSVKLVEDAESLSDKTYHLSVINDGRVLDEKEFITIHRSAESEEDLGEMLEWEFEPVIIGAKNMMLVTRIHNEYDTNETSTELYAFTGKSIKSVAQVFSTSTLYGPSQSYKIEADTTTGDWVNFSVTQLEFDLPVYTDYFEWNNREMIYKKVSTVSAYKDNS